MAAEEVTRTKLFVNTEWKAETCPETIEFNGETITLQWGVNAFADAFGAIAVAKEIGDPVNIDLTGNTTDTSKNISFVGSKDLALTGPEANGETDRFKTNADIQFTGTGSITANNLFRDTKKDAYSTLTIGAGTSVSLKKSSSAQILSDLNTLNVYGDFYADYLRASGSDGGTLNVYSGGKAKIGYLSTSGSAGTDPSLKINVYGDGKAFGDAQLIFSVGNTGDNTADNAMVINVTDYGVMRIERSGDIKAQYFTVRGNQQLNLNNGKLEYVSGGTLTVQGNGQFNMTGASVAALATMIVSNTASVVIDANSSLSVTESLTIAEGASFSIDFTNYDFTKASGSQTILSAGAITGDVAVIGGDKVTEAGYSLVNDGTSVYLTKETNIFVSSDWSGLADGTAVTVNGKEYQIGLNAFGSAIAAMKAVIAVGSSFAEGEQLVINILDGSYSGSAALNFSPVADDYASAVNVDKVVFAGNGSVSYGSNVLFLRYGVQATVEEGVSLTVQGLQLVSDGELDLYGKVILRNGDGALQLTRGKLNVYAGGLLDASYAGGWGYSGTVNVIGDGEAFGDTQIIFGDGSGAGWAHSYLGGNNADRNTADGVLNITENGVVRCDDDLTVGAAFGAGTINLNTGKLTMKDHANTLLNVGTGNTKGTINISNGSYLVAPRLNIGANGTVNMDHTSTVLVNALTITDGGKFTFDLSGVTAAANEEVFKVYTLINSTATAGTVRLSDNELKTLTDKGYTVVNASDSSQNIYFYAASGAENKTVTDLYVTNQELEDGSYIFKNNTGFIVGENTYSTIQAAVDLVSKSDIDEKYTIVLDTGDEKQILTGSKDADPIWGGLLVEDFGGRDVTITGNGVIETSPHEGDYLNGSTFTVITSNVTIDKGVTYINSGHLMTLKDGVLDVYGTINHNDTTASAPFFLIGNGTINIYDGGLLCYPSSNTYSYAGTINVMGNESATTFSSKAQLHLSANEMHVFRLGGLYEGNVDGDGVLNVTDNGYAKFEEDLQLGGAGVTESKSGTLNLNKGKVEVLKTLELGAKGQGGSDTKMGAGFVNMTNGSLLTAKNISVNDAVYGETTTASAFKMEKSSNVSAENVTINGSSSWTMDATSKLTYTGAITVAEGASFTVDLTGVSAESEAYIVILDGDDDATYDKESITVLGEDALAANWQFVNNGNDMYLFDTDRIDMTTVVVDGKNAGNHNYGDVIYTTGSAAYAWNVNAHASMTSVDGEIASALTKVIYISNTTEAEGINTKADVVIVGKNTLTSAKAMSVGSITVQDTIKDRQVEVQGGKFTLTADGAAESIVGILKISKVDTEIDTGADTLTIVNKFDVDKNTTIKGDNAIIFSGYTNKGALVAATVDIAQKTILTLSGKQAVSMILRDKVTLKFGSGSKIYVTDGAFTAGEKAAMLEKCGSNIEFADGITVIEELRDVADLTELESGKYVAIDGVDNLDVYAPASANQLVIGKGEVADYSGIDYNMRGGKNVAIINADADFAIGDLTNVVTVDVKGGSKTGVTKAAFGDITTSAGAGTVKVGNNAEFSADSIIKSDLGGVNTVSFGNNVKGTVGGDISELKSLSLGNGSDLNVTGAISSDNTTFASATLKVGNDSTITAGDVAMSSVTFGKNVIADLGSISSVKALTLGANNDVSINSVDGVAANGAIKAGDGSIVEIAVDVNMRGGKNSIVTGKSSDWKIGGDVMNVNTLTATAAGNWAWNADKTTYTLQHTTLDIDGDFIAGEGAAVLNFGNYSIVEIGGGILESDLGSSFKITVGSNAEVTVSDMIQNLNSLTIGNGVDYKTFTVVEGKAVANADKAIGTTVFSAGEVTGTAGNDTIKIGNKADVTLDKVSLGAGNDTINIGKDSTFEAADVALGAGKNTVVIGAGSWMNVNDISGVNKLTAAGQLSAGDITGTDDFADVVTFNGNAEIGSIDLGDMDDKLVIGKGAEVVINGGISNVEALTIGADAKVSASESTIVAMMELGSAKGSKIDASVEFIALDDAADNAADSTTAYTGNAEAWLGLVDDTADVFSLGTGTDLTGWEIEGAGIKVTVFKQTAEGWDNGTVIEDAVGEGAVADGKFTLGNYTAEGVTAVKVGVSLENSEDAALTKYNVTKLA